MNKIIYYPNYSQLLIRKCVYPPDLTFGILDEQKSARIPLKSSSFPNLESPYQRFLILTNTGMSGMSVNEPIIYVRQSEIQQLQQQQLQLQLQQPQLQLQQQLQLQLQQQQLQQQQPQLQLQQQQTLHFDCCIFSSGYNQLKIMFYDNTTQNFSLDNITQLININTTIIQNLIDIPPEFGNFRRIRNLIEQINNRQQQRQQQQPRHQLLLQQRKKNQLNQLTSIQNSLSQINTIPIQQLPPNPNRNTLKKFGVNQLTRLLQSRLLQQQQQKLQTNRNKKIKQLEDKKREFKKKLKSATNNNAMSNLNDQISIIKNEIKRLTLQIV